MKNEKIKEMLKYIYDRDYSISISAVDSENKIIYRLLCEYIETVGVIKYEELLKIYRDKKLRKVLNER